jgi:hypothetical protein
VLSQIPLNPGIFGVRLYAFRPNGNPNHVVEFYEFQNGKTAIHESKSADDGLPLLLDSLQREKTLAEMFHVLCPDKVIPQALFEADERADCKMQASTSDFTANKTTAPPALPLMPGAPAQANKAATPCSPDKYHDGWGGNWFVYQACPPTGSNRDFGRNRYWLNWYTPDDISTLRWRMMNGDFNLWQHTYGFHRICWGWNCSWEIKWDYYTNPRIIDGWNMWGGSWWVNIVNDCHHAHYTAGWDY